MLLGRQKTWHLLGAASKQIEAMKKANESRTRPQMHSLAYFTGFAIDFHLTPSAAYGLRAVERRRITPSANPPYRADEVAANEGSFL